jgi:serine protease Do
MSAMSRYAVALLAAFGLVSFAGAQESLKPEDLARIKGATVFVKVGVPRSGAIATGSGFLLKSDGETGWLVTNHHVVDLFDGADEAKMLTTPIEVVFDSGTEKERAFKATIAAFDPARDLAMLKIEGAKNLPAPIEIDDGIELRETMLVYICGFPFGGRLAIGTKNPEISIGDAKVSSLRREVAGGPIAKVQLNGALNPGNSGGPVVAANGKLVGVAVTTIRSAGIGNAIPFHEVTSMVRGRLGNVALVPKDEDDDATKPIAATLRSRAIDPFRKIKAVTAHVLPGNASLPAPAPNAPPGVIPGAMKVPLALADGMATADVTVPANGRKSLIVQMEIDYAEGKAYTNAVIVTVGPVRPEMPGRVGPNNRYGPQRTPEGMLKLASGTLLPFPVFPVKFPTAQNSESVSVVNASAEMFAGKPIRMDALSTCVVNPVDRGEFELAVETDSDNSPTEIRVVLPKDLALQVADLGIPDLPLVGITIKFPIRLSGTLGKPSGREKRHSLVVEVIEFLDDDGKPVASFKPATTPPELKTLAVVNRFPEKFVGQTLTVDAYVKGTRHAGGTGLEISNENLANPLNLEIYTSRSLAGQVESDIAKADLPARAKITFEVKAIHGRNNKGVIGIKQVEVLGDDDKAMKTLKATTNVEYPAIPSPPKAVAPKAGGTAGTPVEAPKAVESPTPATKPEGGLGMPVIAAIVGSAALLVVGGFLLLSALRKHKTEEHESDEAEEVPARRDTPKQPEPKPTRSSNVPPKTKTGDDNPFANFG